MILEVFLVICLVFFILSSYFIYRLFEKERKIFYIVTLFYTAWMISFTTLSYENVYRFDEWKKLEPHKNSDTYSTNKKKCINKFSESAGPEYELFDSFTTSIRILEWGTAENTCFNTPSKYFLNFTYILVVFGFTGTIFLVLYEKISYGRNRKKHIIVIGLNQYSSELIKKLRTKEDKSTIIKVYVKDSANIYIDEIKKRDVLVYTGTFESYIEEKNTDIFGSKEIFILNDDDAETLNNLSALIDKKLNLQKKFRFMLK